MMLRKIFSTIVFVLSFWLSATSLQAQIKYSVELEESPEEAQKKVEETLKKIKVNYKLIDETKGFEYRTKTPIFSPFAMNVYIGEFNGKTIVRVDSPLYRTSRAFSEALLQDNGAGPFPVTYRKKTALLAIPLTIISPALGSWYTFVNSPLKPVNFWYGPMVHLLVDAALIFIGGKTFFTHGFDPLNRGIVATSILLAAHRLVHLYVNISAVTAHNRLIKLGYTFRY